MHISTFFLILFQAPVFLSFFWALRKMASAPVESFKEGGMFWFMDLTVPDDYYALPAITCFTLFLTLEVNPELELLFYCLQRFDTLNRVSIFVVLSCGKN